MDKRKDQDAEEAIGWVIRLREADSADWEAFTRWLEADPGHLAAYEEAALIDQEVGLALEPRPALKPRPAPVAANDEPAAERPISRRAALGLAAAAAVVGFVGYGVVGNGVLAPRETLYALETEAGESRPVSLADGSSIMLNGGSRLTLDRDDPRFARLEHGEALFEIAHDPERRFRVEAGGATIRNLGTRFNVVHEGERLKVEVAEGAVLFSLGAREVSLSRGQSVRREEGRIVVGRRDPEEIGAWRRGYLSYSSATLAELADDLSRSSGLSVRAEPAVAGRRFTGVIMLEGGDEQLLRRVGALTGVHARRSGEGWVLAANGG